MKNGSRNMILNCPTVQEAYHAVLNGTSKHRNVIIVGHCWVDYQGRASSMLEPGERTVILKPDGSALVHRSTNYAPINWQPPGSLFRTAIKDGNLSIRAFRRKENETLKITIDKFIMVAVLDLRDSGEFYLHASEKDMQEAILFQPDLLEKGFRPIKAEKSVNPGFIDIMGVDTNNILTIVEIKRTPATNDAVLQLQKYLAVFTNDPSRKVRGILVAPVLAKGAQGLLAKLGLEFKALSPEVCAKVLKQKRAKPLTEFF